MGVVHISWNSLLNITELEFIPAAPKKIKLSDEMIQTLAWLTAATKHDRKLLRCNEFGALLVGNAWDNLSVIETGELHPQTTVPDTYTRTLVSKGIRITTSVAIIKCSVRFVNLGATIVFYLPANWDYFFPYEIYDLIVAVVPDPDGTASYVGITAYG